MQLKTYLLHSPVYHHIKGVSYILYGLRLAVKKQTDVTDVSHCDEVCLLLFLPG